jgi:hypothetical protein
MESGIVMMKQNPPLLPVGLDVFCQLNPESSTELHSAMQNSHFHHASENGLTVLPVTPRTPFQQLAEP